VIQDILLACFMLVAAASFFMVLWELGQLKDLRERVDVLDDQATPSFVEKPKPKAIEGPKTSPDLKQASKVPPPGTLSKEFAGPDGTVYTFRFGEKT
jgi:hypothetical protein